MRKLTAEQIDEAKRMFDAGWSYPLLGERYGVDRQTVKRAIDPEYRALRCLQVREAAKQRRGIDVRLRMRLGRTPAAGVDVGEDGAARLAEIPPDTRTLTQRICGDPIPGDPRRARRGNVHG